MDSKLRKMAISASLAVILLVSIIVFYTNSNNSSQSSQQTGQNQTAHEQQNEVESGLDGGATGTAGNGNESQSPVVNGQIGDDLSAFLKDSTFFDEESDPTPEAAKNQANRLSIIATSVEKDLRIQVVDNDGAPVTGESFYVRLDSDRSSAMLGEYKDLDQDGVIYISDLNSGDYYVELLPIEGYKVPINETRVKVKDKVQYVAIEDISLLIKSEDEVDADAEDSGVRDALADADSTELTSLQQPDGQAKVGIDVSKWQGDIDWDKVKNDGVEFAIIRAGYRGSVTGSIIEDPYFKANMKGAAAAGIPVGVYFFTQAVNEVEAVEEASAVLKLVQQYQLDYPIFIATEGAGGDGLGDYLDVSTRTLVCEAFCRTIENGGYRAGVYASRNWYNNRLETARLDNYYIWLAEYRSVPLYQGYYRMWQHTSKGKVDGIVGNVDLNIAYE